MSSFPRRIGPQADLSELEYIAALQQTCDKRKHGTVSSLDILRYLRSRHGLEITHAQARDICFGLGGGKLPRHILESVAQLASEKQPIEHHEKWKNVGDAAVEQADLLNEILHPKLLYLDVVQLASILWIPMLLQYSARQATKGAVLTGKSNFSLAVGFSEYSGSEYLDGAKKDEGPEPKEDYMLPDDLFQVALRALLEESSAVGTDEKLPDADVKPHFFKAPVLTNELVRAMLVKNGEFERANDEALIAKMVEVAKSPSGLFDVQALIAAVTSDVRDWTPGKENQTTSYVHDVFGTDDLQDFNRQGDVNTKSPQIGSFKKDQYLQTKPKQTRSCSDSVQGEAESADIGSEESQDAIDPAAAVYQSERVEGNIALYPRSTYTIVDTVVDSYGSFLTLLLTWMTYICHSASYASLVLTTDTFTTECPETTFSCTLGATIVSW